MTKFHLIGAKICGALELAGLLCSLWAGNNFSAFVCLCVLAGCCGIVYRCEGWTGRYFSNVTVFELSLDELQARLDSAHTENTSAGSHQP